MPTDLDVKPEKATVYTRVRVRRDGEVIERFTRDVFEARRRMVKAHRALEEGGYTSLYERNAEGEWVLKESTSFDPKAVARRVKARARRALDSARGDR